MPLGLVVLTGTGIEHRYVVGALAAAFPDQLDAVIVTQPTPRAATDRWRRYRRRYTVRQLLSRAVAATYKTATRAHAHRSSAIRRILFPAGDPGQFPRPDKVRAVPSHNGPDALAILEELRPDVIAVFGTLVLKPPVIRTARTAILNMHTGLSPRYRGTDTTFWPLYNEEPEWVGVTVHVLDEGIDSGPILRSAQPELASDDDDASLFAKCVRVGTPLYVDAVRDALAGRVDGRVQHLGDGRNYRGVERTVRAELKVRRLLRNGLLRDRAAEAARR